MHFQYYIGGNGIGGIGNPVGVAGVGIGNVTVVGGEGRGVGVGTGHVVAGGEGTGTGGVQGVGGIGTVIVGAVGTVGVTGEGTGTGTVTGDGAGGGGTVIPGHMVNVGVKDGAKAGSGAVISGKSLKVNVGVIVVTGTVPVTVIATGAATVTGARDIGSVAVVVRALNCLESESGEMIGDKNGRGPNIPKGDKLGILGGKRLPIGKGLRKLPNGKSMSLS